MATEADLTAQILTKGEEIRVIKAAKDESKKEALQAAIAALLALKTQFKELTGNDYGPPPKAKTDKKAAKSDAAAAAPAAQAEASDDPNKKSKKELNKERKKAAKAAMKTGETPAAEEEVKPSAPVAQEAAQPSGSFLESMVIGSDDGAMPEGDHHHNNNDNNNNVRAVSTSTAAARGHYGGFGTGRYTWTDPEKSHCLISLVSDAVTRKPAHLKYMATSEWERLFETFNEVAPEPVDKVKILHNRMSTLRLQCKEYHIVETARRQGLLETEQQWTALIEKDEALSRWRKRPFEFYDEMIACLRLQGEFLDAKKDAKKKAKEASASPASAPAAPAAVAAFTGPVGRVLAVPSAEQDATVVFSSASPALPLASYIVAVLTKQTGVFQNQVDEKTIEPTLVFPNGDVVSGDFAVARFLVRNKQPSLGLFGADNNTVLTSQIDSWLDFALSRFDTSPQSASVAKGLAFLDVVLKTRTFLVGYALSLADICVWAKLTALQVNVATYANVSRWLTYLNAQDLFATAVQALKSIKPSISAKPNNKGGNGENKKPSAESSSSQKGKNTGSCPPLKGAVDGQVVTRFPPEPSGYLHIGHLKACLLNDYYARHYNGKLIVRFDDTNPSKEKDEFEQSILSDLKGLDIIPDLVTYTSDSFPTIITLARQMIQEGNAYMDNTAQEQMRDERMNGVDSVHRNQSVTRNLELFDKMLANDPEAAGYCMRGKIDMQAKNKTLRDPVFFRTNLTPHHRTGTKYCAYPTYDLACPIVDSLEGVTHALRTTEYNDRDEQYQWVLQALKLRKVHIHAFARMNFVHSVLSKRKLQWFVDNNHVTGWNDPRFPTIQGVLRRGVQVSSLREFIVSQGASRRITDMEWDKFWTLNKRVVDPVASRYYALSKQNAVPLVLTNVSKEIIGLPVARHPKDASLGNKIMRFGQELLIEKDDAQLFSIDEEVTLMRHGNIIIRKIEKNPETGEIVKVEAENFPQGDFKKTKLKITWLANVNDLVDCVLVEFDHLISKPKLEENDNFHDFLTPVTRAEMHAIGDHELRNAKQNEIVQLERRGFFRVDEPYISKDKPLVLFMVPDGKAKAMSTLSTNLAHR